MRAVWRALSVRGEVVVAVWLIVRRKARSCWSNGLHWSCCGSVALLSDTNSEKAVEEVFLGFGQENVDGVDDAVAVAMDAAGSADGSASVSDDRHAGMALTHFVEAPPDVVEGGLAETALGAGASSDDVDMIV